MSKQSSILKNNGINYLKSYFTDKKDKDTIVAKFKNISGKTGQYFVPDTLFQKRTNRKNRVLIPFEHILDNHITYKELGKFEGGVVVEFVNNDYFDQLNLPENKQNDVFKRLKDKLGSDENVSAMIDIRSEGESSSQVQREALEKVKKFLQNKNIPVEDALIKRKKLNKKTFPGQGNEYWQGFLYYRIKGGQQDAIDSHEKYGLSSEKVNLFNPSVEYASSTVGDDLTLVLIYFALFSIPTERRNEQWKNMVSEIENYFKTKNYDGKNLYEYAFNHISLKLEPGKLMDPIQIKPIIIEDFIIKNRDEEALDLTHQSSVRRHSYKYDPQIDELLSPARPTNIFWSKHLSNMMQQDYSLKDYFIQQRKIIEKWNEYGLDNLN